MQNCNVKTTISHEGSDVPVNKLFGIGFHNSNDDLGNTAQNWNRTPRKDQLQIIDNQELNLTDGNDVVE